MITAYEHIFAKDGQDIENTRVKRRIDFTDEKLFKHWYKRIQTAMYDEIKKLSAGTIKPYHNPGLPMSF